MLEEKGTLIGKYKGYLIYVLTHDLDSLLAGQFFSPTLFSSNNRLVIVESLATLKRKIDEAKLREYGITGYLPYPVLRIEDKTTLEIKYDEDGERLDIIQIEKYCPVLLLSYSNNQVVGEPLNEKVHRQYSVLTCPIDSFIKNTAANSKQVSDYNSKIDDILKMLKIDSRKYLKRSLDNTCKDAKLIQSIKVNLLKGLF